MKKLLIMFLIISSTHSNTEDGMTVGDLTVEQLTEIVRTILQESLQKCLVTGSMKGRAKVNLAVVGSVEAKMECNFETGAEEIE
tara:strand:- start:408 stop:659 length:252 start_codon:yes stop_codon:yes gene_type:complete